MTLSNFKITITQGKQQQKPTWDLLLKNRLNELKPAAPEDDPPQ